MDNKNNDDSAGSDSLDKSLQKKCIVDDFGDGIQQQKISKEQPSGDIAEQLKTDDVVDDCSGAGGETALPQQVDVGDFTMAGISNNASLNPTITTSSDSETTNTSSKSSSSSLPFETKVKQIAKDLKGTCLADDNAVDNADDNAHSLPEEDVAMCNKITLEDASSSNSSCDVEQNVTVEKDSSSPLPATQEPSLDCSVNPLQPDDEDLETSRCSTEDNDDDEPHSSKSKKVHFHPEVKEHDGGNRVIPKKKKKKETKRLESEMDQDEDEDEADEEDSITKVMAEAEEHLKENPLFEESPDNSTRPRLRDGLLEEEDVKDTAESSEEEDLHANESAPMNGVQRVLGKMIKNNKVFYLVRYVAKETVVGWEPEEFITKECAPLLNDYETHCIKLQERMMRHVSKCQKKRQRYTDF